MKILITLRFQLVIFLGIQLILTKMIHIQFLHIVNTLNHGLKNIILKKGAMNPSGLVGTQKNIMEINLKNGLTKILTTAMELEKIKIAGKKVPVDLFLIMMFI